MKYKKKNIELVINCIADMLSNNAEYGTSGIAENLVDWCENGLIFVDMVNTQQDIQECTEIMNRINGKVDNLTNELYKIFEESEEE